jgi:hypothetical protein
MTFEYTDYIPHGVAALFATVATWVFQDHAKRDERRFDKMGDAFLQMNEKLDKALETQSENHAEILKILLSQKL